MQSGDIDVLEKAVDYFFEESTDNGLGNGVCESLESDIFQYFEWDQILLVLEEKYAKIGNRLYTEHAIGRMLPSSLGRNASVTKEGMGVSPNLVEHVIRKGEKNGCYDARWGKEICIFFWNYESIYGARRKVDS